ncbi:MAG: hypothetical protein ABL964_03720 [Steroidobacteraceae bacterium]
MVCALAFPWLTAYALASEAPAGNKSASPPAIVSCLADGKGFFRARLQGSLKADLDWGNDGTECTGALRPDGGVRLGFSRAIYAEGQRLVVLFGIANLKEGVSARALPVNVTVIRQGTGEFYGTQGDDKCTLDEVRQVPVAGIPLRNRMYHVTARGFCIKPARSLRGDGAVMITRFDFAGRIDFSEADTADDPSAAPRTAGRKSP